MSLADLTGTRRDISFPRVSGDEPTFSVYQYAAMAFSPREWG